jgi:hypothetical protein
LLGYGAHTTRRLFWSSAFLAVVLADTRGVSNAEPQAAAPANHESAFLGTLLDSLAGDAYQPGRRSPLPIDTLFSEGWDEPWVAAPNGPGGDGAPRQAWLNAYDGAFFRLGVATFGYSHDFLDAGFTND